MQKRSEIMPKLSYLELALVQLQRRLLPGTVPRGKEAKKRREAGMPSDCKHQSASDKHRRQERISDSG